VEFTIPDINLRQPDGPCRRASHALEKKHLPEESEMETPPFLVATAAPPLDQPFKYGIFPPLEAAV